MRTRPSAALAEQAGRKRTQLQGTDPDRERPHFGGALLCRWRGLKDGYGLVCGSATEPRRGRS